MSTLAHIKEFQQFLLDHPNSHIDVEVREHHSPGVYGREMFMKAGCWYIGKTHSERHLNILLSGRLTIFTVHGRKDIVGPYIFESMAGVKKVGYAHTDCRYLTVHHNPSDETKEEVLEGMFIRPEEQADLFPELDTELLGVEKCPGELLPASAQA